MQFTVSEFCRRALGLPVATALALAFTGVQAIAAEPAAGRNVVVDRAATRKICQLTGETDRATGQPTINRTESRFGFWGTDLGASFEHDGKLVFLFGDTHAVPGLKRGRDRDLVAVSASQDPEECLKLDVLTDADGGYRPLAVAGVDGGEFSVPSGGFSANGAMHVVVTTDHTPERPMARSVMARSTDGGRTFAAQYDLSRDRFINVAAAQAQGDQARGLPRGMERAVLLWGSGDYRKSDAYLAVLPENRPEDRSGMRYFAGLDGAGEPRWSEREADSAPLFEQACVGELSVAWNPDLAKWVMLYNCGAPQSQILMRTADRPWGPWSNSQVLFDAARDGGFCRYMHAGPEGGCAAQLSDPHSPQTVGDPYAPYLIAKFSRGVAGSHSDIYFLMSAWNPYNVMLMSARLKLDGPDTLVSGEGAGGGRS